MKTSDLSVKELAAFIGVSTDTIRRALIIALDIAKIHDLHFHDHRHTFATRIMQAGIDLYKAQRLLEHKISDHDAALRSLLSRKFAGWGGRVEGRTVG